MYDGMPCSHLNRIAIVCREEHRRTPKLTELIEHGVALEFLFHDYWLRERKSADEQAIVKMKAQLLQTMPSDEHCLEDNGIQQELEDRIEKESSSFLT